MSSNAATEHEHVVAAGLLQKPSRIGDAGILTPEFFTDEGAKGLFALARRFHESRDRKNKLDLALARSLLERATGAKARKLLPIVEEYGEFETVTDAEFREAMRSVTARRRAKLVHETGVKALEASLAGQTKKATDLMRRGLIDADDSDLDDDRPEDIRSPASVERARRDLADEAPAPAHASLRVGFKFLMDAVAFRRSELTIIGGYTGDGKTHLSKTLCYNANLAGARALFVALEMEKEEMRTLFVSHHAATLKPPGVRWTKILDRTADRAERALYNRALDDFEVKKIGDGQDGEEVSTPGGGKLWIWAPRKRLSMHRYTDRVKAMVEDEGLDLAVLDYLGLLQASRDLGQYRLNLKDMADECKVLSRETKIHQIVNHQISKEGREKAEKRKPIHYEVGDLGESSGVGQAADVSIWTYVDPQLKEMREAVVGVSKARKGDAIFDGRHIMADFAHGYMGEMSGDRE